MGSKLATLAMLAGLAGCLLAAAPAEAGWKWKKMRWEPKHGQEYRSPYAHRAPDFHGGYGGHRYGGGSGYGRYGYDRYSYGRPYGYAAPSYGPHHGLEW